MPPDAIQKYIKNLAGRGEPMPMSSDLGPSRNPLRCVPKAKMAGPGRLWVISGCAGPAAARQVHLNKRTSTRRT
jgi:hypothetical protein